MRASAAGHLRSWTPTVGLGLCVGLAAVLPLLLRGPSCGQDFDFHLQSWLAVRAAWHAGLVVPHWVPAANYGAGEPRLVFYPALSWLLGALLSLVLPWAWVPAAFTGVCLAGTAGAMYRVAGRLCGGAGAALAAVVYALSPYLLFTGYERTAYGELLAAVWMPGLLGALLVPRLPVARLALLLAACWYSNAPAGVMGCYLVAFALVGRAIAGQNRLRGWRSEQGQNRLRGWRSEQEQNRLRGWRSLRDVFSFFQRLLPGGVALLLGCGLAADYLLPAWYEGRFVSLDRAVGPGLRVQDSWLFAHTGEPYHDQVLRTASWIAVATLGAGLLAACVVLLRRQPAPTRRTAALLGAILLACLLLQFPFTALVWRHLPEFTFLQFPWRLLLPASAATALLVALAAPRLPRKRFAIALVAMSYAIGMVAWAGATRYQPCDDEDKVPAQLLLLQGAATGQEPGFEGTDEYAAAGADNGEIAQGLPRVRLLPAPDAEEADDSRSPNPAYTPAAAAQVAGQVEIQGWQPESLLVRVRPEKGGYTVLRLERFPAWQVRLNGAPCGAACVARDDGLLTVRVPGRRWSRIEASYRTTADVRWARVLSLGALLILLGLWRVGYAGRSVMIRRK